MRQVAAKLADLDIFAREESSCGGLGAQPSCLRGVASDQRQLVAQHRSVEEPGEQEQMRLGHLGEIAAPFSVREFGVDAMQDMQ